MSVCVFTRSDPSRKPSTTTEVPGQRFFFPPGPPTSAGAFLPWFRWMPPHGPAAHVLAGRLRIYRTPGIIADLPVAGPRRRVVVAAVVELALYWD